MEEVDGERSGSRRFFYEGYAYHHDLRIVTFNSCRCAMRARFGCSGQVRVDGNEVHVIEQHATHDPNPYIVLEARMRAELLRLCRQTVRAVSDIYREVAFRYERPVVEAVSLQSMRSAMDRERYRGVPEVPRDLVTLGTFLRDFPITQAIYRGTATGTDGISALLFATNDMIERLNDTRDIFVSSTIPINAGPTRAYKMVIMYAKVMETVVPMVYILFREKSKLQFLAVWRLVLGISPRIQVNLRTAICSYDGAIIGSLRVIFPEITITGCWFFYFLELCRKWMELRLATTPQNALWMAVALPLAPVARFAEGLTRVVEAGDRLANEHPSVLQFLHYLRIQWLPLADLVSVSRDSLQINDLCETFHRHVFSRLGGPNRHLWSFFGDRLNRLIEYSENQWQAPPPNGRNRLQQREEARINRIQDQLSIGRLNIEEFLLSIADHRRRAQIGAIVRNVVDDFGGDNDIGLDRADFLNNAPDAANNAGNPVARDLPVNNQIVDVPHVPLNMAGQVEEAPPVDEEIDGDPNDPIFDPDFGRAPNNDDIGEQQNAGEIANIVEQQNDGEIVGGARNDDHHDQELIEAAGNEQQVVVEIPNDRVIVERERDDEQPGIVVFTQRPCSACLAERPRLVYGDCGHLAICEKCDLLLTTRNCPICRAFILSKIKVFYV